MKVFRRRASYLLKSILPVLIEYTGDQDLAIREPHGNLKNIAGNIPHQRTKPSILKNSYEKLKNVLPGDLYRTITYEHTYVLVRCWRHLGKSLERWLRVNNITDISFYKTKI